VLGVSLCCVCRCVVCVVVLCVSLCCTVCVVVFCVCVYIYVCVCVTCCLRIGIQVDISPICQDRVAPYWLSVQFVKIGLHPIGSALSDLLALSLLA